MSHFVPTEPGPVPDPSSTESATPPERRWDSRSLLGGLREVVIQHGDQLYRLRHTQNDKLILTK